MDTESQVLHDLHEDKCPALKKKDQAKVMKTWIRKPSSILLCALSTICILLLFIIIILLLAVKNCGCNQMEQIQNLSAAVRSDVERLSKQTSLEKDLQSVLSIMGRLPDMLHKRNASLDYMCNANWRYYDFSCYYVSNTFLSWPNAKKRCEEFNAHLVVINNEEEQEEMNIFSRGRATWIGLTDDGGEWRWVDGSSYTSSVTFWGEGQPDDGSGHGLGRGEDCAQIQSGESWNDDLCSRRLQFICEIEFAKCWASQEIPYMIGTCH